MNNNFTNDLNYSFEDQEFWKEVYKIFFPNMVGMHSHNEYGNHQLNGIDRSITLLNGKTILLDEKSRRIEDTGDIMLEYVSNNNYNSPSWCEKELLCDYIVYAFIPSKKAYLLPTAQLQQVWKKNKEVWLDIYGRKKVKNDSYETLCCPVKTETIYQAISDLHKVKIQNKILDLFE